MRVPWSYSLGKDSAGAKGKLAKYRARITAARNVNNNIIMLEQIRKYSKWMPGSCYEQLIRAECAIVTGDLALAQRHLQLGLSIDEDSIDRLEAMMWRVVVACVVDDAQACLK